MTNTNFIEPVYFGFLREMITRAETHSSQEFRFYNEQTTTNRLYEIEALHNVLGELECARAECERRIRYLETKVAEDV